MDHILIACATLTWLTLPSPPHRHHCHHHHHPIQSLLIIDHLKPLPFARVSSAVALFRRRYLWMTNQPSRRLCTLSPRRYSEQPITIIVIIIVLILVCALCRCCLSFTATEPPLFVPPSQTHGPHAVQVRDKEGLIQPRLNVWIWSCAVATVRWLKPFN